MDQSELIEDVARTVSISRAEAARILAATIATIVTAVASGDAVNLHGFGTFRASRRAVYKRRHPATREAATVVPDTLPLFKVGANFKAVYRFHAVDSLATLLRRARYPSAAQANWSP